MYTKFDVQQLMHDVAALKANRQAAHVATLEEAKVDKVPVPENDVALAAMDDLPLEWEVREFGLEAHMRDPVSGLIVVACRPAIDAQAEVMLTAYKIDGLLQDAHGTVLAARMKAAEKTLAEAKAKADKAKADKEAKEKADAAKASVTGRSMPEPDQGPRTRPPV